MKELNSQKINHIMAGEARFSILAEDNQELEEVKIQYAWDPKSGETHGIDTMEK